MTKDVHEAKHGFCLDSHWTAIFKMPKLVQHQDNIIKISNAIQEKLQRTNDLSI